MKVLLEISARDTLNVEYCTQRATMLHIQRKNRYLTVSYVVSKALIPGKMVRHVLTSCVAGGNKWTRISNKYSKTV